MDDVEYLDIPALTAGIRSINIDTDVCFFRKALAQRNGFGDTSSTDVAEAVLKVRLAGYELLGRGELHFLIKQSREEALTSRKLRFIRNVYPFDMPILLFPADDLSSGQFPALAPLPGWSQVLVNSKALLCSSRFLLPVKNPAA